MHAWQTMKRRKLSSSPPLAGCAPSNGPTLYDTSAWQPLVLSGYAVVATDYAGLGNNYTTRKWTSYPAQLNDVYYSVVAASQAFGGLLSKQWFSIGHSQGGGTVWRLAESEFVRAAESGYLGTVALAPAAYAAEMIVKNLDSYPYPGIAAALTAAIHWAQPDYEPTCLTPTMANRLELEDKAQVCFFSAIVFGLDLAHRDVMTPEGLANDWPQILQRQDNTAPALGAKSSAPILVIQGGKDSVVPPNFTEKAYEKSCAAGNEVHLMMYPGMEHSSVIPASSLDWIPWVNELFKGKRQRTNCTLGCSKTTRNPLNAAGMKAPPEVGV